MNIGYACINMQLSYPQKYGGKEKGVKPITTGRSMIKRTFDTKGVDYASELALANAKDLDKIISWNILNDYKFFRITSGLAPWKSEYEWEDLKDLKWIKLYLHSAGVKVNTHGVRITSHPGPFNVLTSPHEHVVKNCIGDLTMHGDTFDMMGLSRTPYNKINIHIGGAYGDKPKSMERFCKNFERLPDRVKELYHGVYSRIGVPIVFDYHHHRFCDGGLSEQEALEMAISTWPKDITPVVHYSESRSKERLDESIRPQAHSDYVYDYIDNYGHDIDIMIEAKHKELAVAKYLELHG
jgi:UV DNA damage endonuclease